MTASLRLKTIAIAAAALVAAGCGQLSTIAEDPAVQRALYGGNTSAGEPGTATAGANEDSSSDSSRSASTGGGSRTSGSSGPSGDNAAPNTKAPSAINIGGESYVQADPNSGRGGFFYAGKYYRKSSTPVKGVEFVQGDRSKPGGFWQDGKYWVPRNGGFQGGGDGLAPPPPGKPHVIRIPGQAFVESSPGKGSGGFWQNGKYYLPEANAQGGDEYVEGDRSMRGGFHYNGKYYVRKSGTNLTPAARHVINIGNRSFVESDPGQGGDGFWHDGKFYLPAKGMMIGDAYVAGNPSQGGGFTYKGVYYVKR
jgi:hypothetical protein